MKYNLWVGFMWSNIRYDQQWKKYSKNTGLQEKVPHSKYYFNKSIISKMYFMYQSKSTHYATCKQQVNVVAGCSRIFLLLGDLFAV